MYRSCTSNCSNPTEVECIKFHGYLKGKESTLMIYDRHPELQSKWIKPFGQRGYYVETIGNIMDECSSEIYKEQAEESRKRRFKKYRFIAEK